MKLWEIITTVRDLGGTMEDVRELLRMEQDGTNMDEMLKPRQDEAPSEPVEAGPSVVENPVDNVDNANEELEALRLENAQLKGQLQTYNILHASMHDVPQSTPADNAVQIGLDMIK